MSVSNSDYLLYALGAYGLDISESLADSIVSWSADYLNTYAGINILDGVSDSELTGLEAFFTNADNVTAFALATADAPWFTEFQAVLLQAIEDGSFVLDDSGTTWDDLLNDISDTVEDALELYGTDGDDDLVGSSQDDTLVTGAGNDSVEAGDGDDLIISTSGINTLFGGNGVDHVEYSGNFLERILEQQEAYLRVYADNNNNDQLFDIEYLTFDDGELSTERAVELRDTFESFTRLYTALLGRNPDDDGLKYWVNDLSSGNSLQNAAYAFTESAEYLARFGQQSYEDFIDALYSNILGRSADDDGFNYWLEELQGSDDRGGMIVSFSNSVEYIDTMSETVNTYLSSVTLDSVII